MQFDSILWDRNDDPLGNVQHIAKHNLTTNEVENALNKPLGRDISRSSGLPVVFGNTGTGRHIMVVYKVIDASTVRPITAFDVPKRKRT